MPPELTARWTKERRFGLAWDLVRAIRPSMLLFPASSAAAAEEGGGGSWVGSAGLEESSVADRIETVPFESAPVQDAYERLDSGEIITALFKF